MTITAVSYYHNKNNNLKDLETLGTMNWEKPKCGNGFLEGILENQLNQILYGSALIFSSKRFVFDKWLKGVYKEIKIFYSKVGVRVLFYIPISHHGQMNSKEQNVLRSKVFQGGKCVEEQSVPGSKRC